MNGQVVAVELFAEKWKSRSHCLHLQVHPDVLYLNLEPDFAGIRPPSGKNLNDIEYLALAFTEESPLSEPCGCEIAQPSSPPLSQFKPYYL